MAAAWSLFQMTLILSGFSGCWPPSGVECLHILSSYNNPTLLILLCWILLWESTPSATSIVSPSLWNPESGNWSNPLYKNNRKCVFRWVFVLFFGHKWVFVLCFGLPTLCLFVLFLFFGVSFALFFLTLSSFILFLFNFINKPSLKFPNWAILWNFQELIKT